MCISMESKRPLLGDPDIAPERETVVVRRRMSVQDALLISGNSNLPTEKIQYSETTPGSVIFLDK